MATTKTYNGIEFFETHYGSLRAYGKLAVNKDSVQVLEQVLCEYVKDEPMTREFWRVEAELESGEILEIFLPNVGDAFSPWDCGVIEYRLNGKCHHRSYRTEKYEYYQMVGGIKKLINESESKSDEDFAECYPPMWARRLASAVRMYPDEFTEEEKAQAERIYNTVFYAPEEEREQGERISRAILDNEQ